MFRLGENKLDDDYKLKYPVHQSCWSMDSKHNEYAYAAQYVESSLDICPLLFNMQDDNGLTPLHLLAMSQDDISKDLAYKFSVSMLIRLIGNKDGYTPLHVYAASNKSETPYLRGCLIDMAARSENGLNALDRCGDSALTMAIRSRNDFFAESLIMCGAKLTANDIELIIYTDDRKLYWILKDKRVDALIPMCSAEARDRINRLVELEPNSLPLPPDRIKQLYSLANPTETVSQQSSPGLNP